METISTHHGNKRLSVKTARLDSILDQVNSLKNRQIFVLTRDNASPVTFCIYAKTGLMRDIFRDLVIYHAYNNAFDDLAPSNRNQIIVVAIYSKYIVLNVGNQKFEFQIHYITEE